MWNLLRIFMVTWYTYVQHQVAASSSIELHAVGSYTGWNVDDTKCLASMVVERSPGILKSTLLYFIDIFSLIDINCLKPIEFWS